MCPSSGLWGGVLDCDSQFTTLSPPSFDGPQLWRFTSVCSSLYLLTRAHCAQCSPSIPLYLTLYLLAPAWGRSQSPDCALRIPVSHDQRRACLFFSLYIKLFELGVEIALNHRSTVTYHKINLLKFPLRSSNFERTNDAFLLLICFCVFHLKEPLVPICRSFEFY